MDAQLALHARRHHGVFTTRTAVALGKTEHQVRSAVQRGELERVHPEVLRIAGAPRTWHQAVLIAVLAAGDGALASHRTSSALWHLDGSSRGRPELVTPRHLRSRYGGARVHESTDLHLAQATERDGIPCTGVERTLIDLGAVVPIEQLQQAADDAVRRRITSWEELIHQRALHSRRGRRGVGPLRVVIERSINRSVPDSHFNRLVQRLLVASGLPEPIAEHEVRDARGNLIGRVDLAYPEHRVGLELDSRRHHMTTAAFESDRPRQNQLELAGWMILRYTWRFYLDAPSQICIDVARALRLREPGPPGSTLRQIPG